MMKEGYLPVKTSETSEGGLSINVEEMRAGRDRLPIHGRFPHCQATSNRF